MSNTINAPDLTQRPPRSTRVRLGNIALLPRMLDKGRATIIGKNGEYHYNCPLDQHVINFLGIGAEALKKELAAGKGDWEILEWINANAKNKRSAWEIAQWSDFQQNRTPDSDQETSEFFFGLAHKLNKSREDLRTWSELLDADDHVTFGGKA